MKCPCGCGNSLADPFRINPSPIRTYSDELELMEKEKHELIGNRMMKTVENEDFSDKKSLAPEVDS